MIKINIKEKESIENILKRFRNIVEKNNIISDFKKNINYKKPSVLKKIKNLNKIKILQKKFRNSIINKNLY